jgi:hypothetical protein
MYQEFKSLLILLKFKQMTHVFKKEYFYFYLAFRAAKAFSFSFKKIGLAFTECEITKHNFSFNTFTPFDFAVKKETLMLSNQVAENSIQGNQILCVETTNIVFLKKVFFLYGKEKKLPSFKNHTVFFKNNLEPNPSEISFFSNKKKSKLQNFLFYAPSINEKQFFVNTKFFFYKNSDIKNTKHQVLSFRKNIFISHYFFF